MKKRKSNESVIGSIFNYSELVDYQDNSIVSRTIIDNPSGTVTIFAFAQGQRLSTHTAPYDALINIIDGKGEFSIEDKIFQITDGHQIILPAGKPHSVNAIEKFKMVLTMIKSKKDR